MKISKETYKEAKRIVKQYKEQENKRIDLLLPIIEAELTEYFKSTYIEKFLVYIEDKSFIVLSKKPIFDEDYSGSFDPYMEKLSKKHNILIQFEPFNYGK